MKAVIWHTSCKSFEPQRRKKVNQNPQTPKDELEDSDPLNDNEKPASEEKKYSKKTPKRFVNSQPTKEDAKDENIE